LVIATHDFHLIASINELESLSTCVAEITCQYPPGKDPPVLPGTTINGAVTLDTECYSEILLSLNELYLDLLLEEQLNTARSCYVI
jgi:hypothetical protein